MRNFCVFIVFSGVAIRFILQFVFPSFNVDEIALGNNILHKNFYELMYPLDSFQSSPPLYLLTQKLIISVFPFDFWVNIKLLSFISSVLGLLLFYKLIKNQKLELVLFALVLFAFNPFLLNNTLTVKQYTLDLLGVMVVLNFYKTQKFIKYGFVFFCIWGLFSNIGLFSCAGYLLYRFFEVKHIFSWDYLKNFITQNVLLILAPIPYVVYFFWYMQQNGALEMKAFMVDYWQSSFLPLNAGIFKYTMYLLHGFWFCFYNAVELFGVFLFILPFTLIYLLVKGKDFIFQNEIKIMAAIFAVHLVLNICQVYPLSNRLYVYLMPFFVLILIASLQYLSTLPLLKKSYTAIILILAAINLGFYITYLPYKENNICALYEKLNNMNYTNKPVYLSPSALVCISDFNEFTAYKLTNDNALKFYEIDSDLKKSDILITRVHHKMGPLEETAKEETVMQSFIDSGRLKLIDKVDGYNLYKIK